MSVKQELHRVSKNIVFVFKYTILKALFEIDNVYSNRSSGKKLYH